MATANLTESGDDVTSPSRSRSVAALFGLVAVVILLLVAYVRLAVPDTRELTDVVACEGSFAVVDGFTAFDFGSLPNAEVPNGQTVYRVHSNQRTSAPPPTWSDLFVSWPTWVSEQDVELQYLEFVSASSPARVTHEADNGCVVSVSFEAGASYAPAVPRSDEWSVVLTVTDP